MSSPASPGQAGVDAIPHSDKTTWTDFSNLDRADRLARRIIHTWYDTRGQREREQIMDLKEGRLTRRRMWQRNTGEEQWQVYRHDPRGRVSTVERYYLGDVVERREYVYLPDGRVKKDRLADGYAVLKDYRRFFYHPDGVAEIFDEFAQPIGKAVFDKAGNPLSLTITADPARGRKGLTETSAWERVAPLSARIPTEFLQALGYRIRRASGEVWFRKKEEQRADGRVVKQRETLLKDSLPARETVTGADGETQAFTFTYTITDGALTRCSRVSSSGNERESWTIEYRTLDGE